MDKYGEIVHGHNGQYETYHYERNIDFVESNHFLQYTDRGSNDSGNQILILGDSQPAGYIWSSYYAEQKATNVSMGYKNAVYMEYGLKVLDEIETLIFFPFLKEEECMEYLSGKREFDHWKRMSQIGIPKYRKNPREVTISKELLKRLVCYCLARKQEHASKFLYLLVPTDIKEYQEYCRDIIWQILMAIPLGLRRNLRIATNAAVEQEQNFDILFRRVSDTEIPNSLCLESPSDCAFLDDINLSKELEAFLTSYLSDQEYQKQCNQFMLKFYDDKALLTQKDYIEAFKPEIPQDRQETDNDNICVENLLKWSEQFRTMNEQDRQPALEHICESISVRFQNQKMDYEEVIEIYHAFLSMLYEDEKDRYLTERELQESFENRLFYALRAYLCEAARASVICQALAVAVKEIENFSQKTAWGETLASDINTIIERSDFSDIERNQIFEKLWIIYGTEEAVLGKLRELFRKGLQKDEKKKILQQITSLEAYFLYFRGPSLLYGDIYMFQQEVRNQIIERWPLHKKSLGVFISAVIAVEGKTLEELRETDGGAIQHYRQECQMFFKNNNGIVLRPLDDPSQIFTQLLFYQNIFGQEFITLYYAPVKKQRFSDKTHKQAKRFKVEAVQKCLRRIISIRSHITALEELQEGLGKEENDCLEFLITNVFELEIPGEEEVRKKGIKKRIRRLVFGGILVVLLISAILLGIFWSRYLLSSGNQANLLKMNLKYAEKVNEQAEGRAEPVKIVQTPRWKENHVKMELSESDKNSLSKLYKAYAMWSGGDYASAYDELNALSLKQLASYVWISPEHRRMLFQYLALQIIQSLKEEKQIAADDIKSVEIYRANIDQDIDEMFRSRFPVILVTYSDGDSGNYDIYYYEETSKRYLSYSDLYGGWMESEELEQKLQEFANILKNEEKEKLEITSVDVKNVKGILAQIDNPSELLPIP